MLCPTEPPINPPEPAVIASCYVCGFEFFEGERVLRYAGQVFCDAVCVVMANPSLMQQLIEQGVIDAGPVEVLVAGYPPEPDNRADVEWERD